MAYQALLFCPDEKTARTVTQVLSELDFEVSPCTEPFAAVKKLMAEHFDAVVVDCDNEQNATLLFKSARNSPNNQSALAVAVVEGQAGVAKAFRIGANLVLTKPINVEQAKGTLRVARGLLRKNDSAKPATSAASAKPSAPAPVAAKPVLVSSNATLPQAAAPISSPHIPAPKETPQSSFAASASSAITESAGSQETHSASAKISASASQAAWAKTDPPAAAKPPLEQAASKPEVTASSNPGTSSVSSAGSASAPARAKEPEPAVPSSDKKPSVVPEFEPSVDRPVAGASSAQEALPAPSFSFGGAVAGEAPAASGGSKKALIAVAAVVLIVAGGYAAWTQFGPAAKSGTPASVAAKPVAVANPPQPASQPTDSAPSISSTTTAAAQPAGTSSPASNARKVSDADKAPAHPGDAKPEPSKSSASAGEENMVAANKVSAKPAATPILVKKAAAQPGSAKAGSADAPMPSITGIAPAGNGASLPNLMDGASKAPTPVLQAVNVSQGVSQGLVIKRIPPTYPANALRMHVEGSVQLLATVSKKGDISAVKVLSGDPNLARAASDAVKQWKYKPYLLDGSPVEIQTQVTVNFKLPR